MTKYDPDYRLAPRRLYCGKMSDERPDGEGPKWQPLSRLTSGGLIGAGIRYCARRMGVRGHIQHGQ